jgi:hypothetical protein
MFGCAAAGNGDPVPCFVQKTGARDAFATKADWTNVASATMRTLKANLPYESNFFTRISPDGRFVGHGGGVSSDGTIWDLRGELPDHRARSIAIDAPYDPNFMPDGSGFLFPGQSCAMSLLTDPGTRHVDFKESACTTVTSIDVYMYSAASLDGGDYFVVNGPHENDQIDVPGGRDPGPHFGADSEIQVTPMVFDGKNFKPSPVVRSPLPWEGDMAVSPSGRLIAARFGTSDGTELGYRLSFLTATRGDDGYTVKTEDAGTICAKGTKALISYDERFMAIHHFADESDFAEYGFASKDDPSFVDLITKGVADVYLVDLSTGAKTRVTRMPAGHYALYPNFRSDGWLYFLDRDVTADGKVVESIMATDAALRLAAANP